MKWHGPLDYFQKITPFATTLSSPPTLACFFSSFSDIGLTRKVCKINDSSKNIEASEAAERALLSRLSLLPLSCCCWWADECCMQLAGQIFLLILWSIQQLSIRLVWKCHLFAYPEKYSKSLEVLAPRPLTWLSIMWQRRFEAVVSVHGTLFCTS